jgi:hypothetical protein
MLVSTLLAKRGGTKNWHPFAPRNLPWIVRFTPKRPSGADLRPSPPRFCRTDHACARVGFSLSMSRMHRTQCELLFAQKKKV